MKNEITISTDNINVYAVIKIKGAPIGIRVLSVFVGLAMVFFVVLLTKIKTDELTSMIIPLMISLVLIKSLGLKKVYWKMVRWLL